MKELREIQKLLKAPKGQYNKFGGYKYRSCEDILNSVKALLDQTQCFLTISDEVVCIGNRYYVKATATLTNSEGVQVSTCAYAREDEQKKGMDASQLTGATSSYARKYALNGLFCIDDTKDADTEVFSLQTNSQEDIDLALDDLKRCKTSADVKQTMLSWIGLKDNETFKKASHARYNELNNGTKNN